MSASRTKIKPPNFAKPSSPRIETLATVASKGAWELAIKESRRSPMGIYGTGAVLVSKHGEVISSGCAHPSPDGTMRTTHAERHSLIRVPQDDLRDSLCLVYTSSSKSGGSPWTSRPCLNCARALVKRGVRAAAYPVRDRDSGLWRVEIDNMEDALSDWASGGEKLFARSLMRN